MLSPKLFRIKQNKIIYSASILIIINSSWAYSKRHHCSKNSELWRSDGSGRGPSLSLLCNYVLIDGARGPWVAQPRSGNCSRANCCAGREQGWAGGSGTPINHAQPEVWGAHLFVSILLVRGAWGRGVAQKMEEPRLWVTLPGSQFMSLTGHAVSGNTQATEPCRDTAIDSKRSLPMDCSGTRVSCKQADLGKSQDHEQ